MRALLILSVLAVSNMGMALDAAPIRHSQFITQEEATRIAREKCSEDNTKDIKFVIAGSPSEHAFGWVYLCTTEKYLKTRDIKYSVPGVGPLIVNREGKAEFLGTSRPPYFFIKEYEDNWKRTRMGSKSECPVGEYSKIGKLGVPICCPNGAVCD